MAKKRISNRHSLTFLPAIWDGLVKDAKKAKLSVSKYISELYKQTKNK